MKLDKAERERIAALCERLPRAIHDIQAVLYWEHQGTEQGLVDAAEAVPALLAALDESEARLDAVRGLQRYDFRPGTTCADMYAYLNGGWVKFADLDRALTAPPSAEPTSEKK